MDKLFALIQKTPVSQKVALMVFLMGGMAAGHYFFVYRGQDEEIDKLDRRLESLERELAQKQEIAANLSQFRKEVEFLKQKLEEKKKNLPDDANLDQLLRTLNELSEKSDMRIVKFTPQSEVPKNFYAEIPVKMEIEGNYHEIATFFDKISKEERIINISGIGLGDPQTRNGKVVLKGGCLAKTFKSLPPKPQPTGAAGQPGRRGARGR